MTEISAVSTAPGIGDRSLLPVPPQRSPNDRRLAQPQEPARPAREPPFASITVPETSTWVMLLLGFAGLGYAGYAKSRPNRLDIA
jgi:hypothetical protein